MKIGKREVRLGMLPLLTVVVFGALAVNATISALIVFVLIHGGFFSLTGSFSQVTWKLIIIHFVVSLILGILISLGAVAVLLRPVRNLISSMNRLARGDFAARIQVGPVMKKSRTFVAAAESFNTLAQQLENTELLRSDFVNNFSHEFKTPIVSIAGFAKLLRRGNLPQAEQAEYLRIIEEESMRLSYMATNVLNLTKVENQTILTDVEPRGNLPQAEQAEYLRIIEEESMRLSYMATNVLNLTKVENQTILTDVEPYNLSEQLRGCILLLEREWEQKNLDLQLELGEYQIQANQELLKQVWINLLDNAIKFAPEGHTVRITIQPENAGLAVSITNTGSEIPLEKQDKIFNKFYQADESHVTKGNGVGLAIVKRIVQLHEGSIELTSDHEVTTFTVHLPR